MSIGRRLRWLRAYWSPARGFDLSLWALLLGLMRSPCTVRAPRKIREMVRDEDCLRVALRGLDRDVYWPADESLYSLHMIIAEGLYEDDWHYYQIPETRVAPGDIVIDCGAAEGLFAISAASVAERVFAFEPNPVFLRALRKGLRPLENAEVVPVGVGVVADRAHFGGGLLNGRLLVGEGEGAGESIQIVALDEWAAEHGLPRVDYIKADIEGSELDMLRGAAGLIREHRPRIAITTYHGANDWRQMLALCRELVPGYQYRTKGMSVDGTGACRPVMLHLWV